MKNALILFLLFTSMPALAQVQGWVASRDSKDRIPFTSIMVANTYTGTSTNDNGNYSLAINKKGRYTLIFQSLGYKTREVTIDVVSLPHILNVTLEKENYILNEANAYNAKEIIREAIENREANFRKTAKFEADFYSRGVFRLRDVPEKVLGQEIGDLGSSLDSTRSGIIYLSETVSRVKYHKPGQVHEQVIASKISGEDNGYSYNNAAAAEFDFYQNYLPFEVNVVSPVANNALSYYDYTSQGAFNDREQHLIYKIGVIPKRGRSPAMTGHIYIVEGSWELYAIDLSITGSLIEKPFIDTLSIRQNFGYNATEKLWTKNTQVLDFNASIFGVDLIGRFSHIYSNFIIDPPFDDSAFSAEVLAFDKDANKKNSAFWDSNRPIPLTFAEREDYRKKDSLQEVRATKAYMEESDRARNRFSWLSPILGYTYYNTPENWEVSYTGIVRRLGFNTVQAYALDPGIYFTKHNPDEKTYTTIGTDVNYGFAEQRFRATGTVSRKFNNFNNLILTLRGGSSIEQFNPEKPINRIVNSISTLFFRDNYMKLYDNSFVRLGYEQEVVNGIYLYGNIEYTRRHALYNNTNFSTLKDAYKPYTSNNPLLPYDYDTPAFLKHNMVKASLSTRISFGQKYWTRPDGREIIPNDKYPRLYLKYEKGFASSIDDYNFDHLSARVTYDVTIGNKGELGTSFRAGKFFNSDNIAFVDYRHFNGNQTHVGKSERYLNVFNFLPYYTHSTNDAYFEGHLEHNFQGFITDALPLFERLNYYLVAGYHVLAVPERNPYMEFTIGLDNVGWGKFRFLRIDYIRSYESGFVSDGVIFGLTFLDILE